MKQTIIKNIATGITKKCDILSKNDNFLEVVLEGTTIKIILKKDGKFAGTCASQSPFLNKEGETCGFCGKTPDEMCPNES